MASINLRGYDPTLAEEELERQRQAGQEQIGQIAQRGQIAAQGINDAGSAYASMIPNAVNGYFKGKKMAEDSEAHKEKMALSEEELKSQKAANDLQDAQAQGLSEEEGSMTNRQYNSRLAQGKTKAETAALLHKDSTADWEKTDQLDASGHPLSFNKRTNKWTADTSITGKSKTDDIKPVLVDDVDPVTGKERQRFIVPSPTAVIGPKPHPEKGPQKITAAEAGQIGSYDTALANIEDLEKSYNKLASSRGSGLKSLIPSTDADKYDKAADLKAQAIGTILEGGKLSDADYEKKYKKFVPRAGDSNAIAAQKAAEFKKVILQKKIGALGGLKQSGFDTSGFGPVPDPDKITSLINTGKGSDTALAAPGGKSPVKKEYSTRLKSTRVTYSDGSTEVIPDAQ